MALLRSPCWCVRLACSCRASSLVVAGSAIVAAMASTLFWSAATFMVRVSMFERRLAEGSSATEFGDLRGPVCFLYDRSLQRTILPDADVWHLLEKEFDGVCIKRFGMIEPIRVVVIMPVKAELESQRCIDREGHILRSQRRAVSPVQVGAEWDCGSEEVPFGLEGRRHATGCCRFKLSVRGSRDGRALASILSGPRNCYRNIHLYRTKPTRLPLLHPRSAQNGSRPFVEGKFFQGSGPRLGCWRIGVCRRLPEKSRGI